MLITRPGKASRKTGVMMRMKPASATQLTRWLRSASTRLRVEGPSTLPAVIDDDRGMPAAAALEAIRIRLVRDHDGHLYGVVLGKGVNERLQIRA